jgi:hypothetical protein
MIGLDRLTATSEDGSKSTMIPSTRFSWIGICSNHIPASWQCLNTCTLAVGEDDSDEGLNVAPLRPEMEIRKARANSTPRDTHGNMEALMTDQRQYFVPALSHRLKGRCHGCGANQT